MLMIRVTVVKMSVLFQLIYEFDAIKIVHVSLKHGIWQAEK